jgi:phosphotransferase system IIB component
MRVLLVLSILLLSACEHPLPKAPGELTFSGTPYRFNVARVDIVEDYAPPRRAPNVEHLSGLPPAEAVKRWAASQIVAAGDVNRLEVDIKDASIVKKDLPKQKRGIEGWFTKEQTEQYDATLDVDIKLYSSHRILPVAHAQAVVHQTQTLREDATLVDRKNLYSELSIQVMHALEVEMDKNIHLYFANYLM